MTRWSLSRVVARWTLRVEATYNSIHRVCAWPETIMHSGLKKRMLSREKGICTWCIVILAAPGYILWVLSCPINTVVQMNYLKYQHHDVLIVWLTPHADTHAYTAHTCRLSCCPSSTCRKV